MDLKWIDSYVHVFWSSPVCVPVCERACVCPKS